MKEKNYLTPQELIELYPNAQIIGWTAAKIGIFYSAGLLIGHHSSKERKALILESSFRELLAYANNVTKKRIIDLE